MAAFLECEFCGEKFDSYLRRHCATCSPSCAEQLRRETMRFNRRLPFTDPIWTHEREPVIAPMWNSCDVLREFARDHGEWWTSEEERTQVFLRYYSRTGNARAAANLVGYPITTHHDRKRKDADYAARVAAVKPLQRKNAQTLSRNR